MKILAILLGMLFTCWGCGAMLSSLFRRDEGDPGLVATYGYAYTHVAFYSLYMVLRSVTWACGLVLCVPVALAGGMFVYRHFRVPAWRSALPDSLRLATANPLRFAWPLAIGLVVILLAAWPHLYAGYGHYWHSGNYDLDDGLRGREAYLEYTIFEESPAAGEELILERVGDKTWVALVNILHIYQEIPAPEKVQRRTWHRDWYAGDFFRFQYSSLAFWSALFREPFGMDIALIQMVLGLVLMARGVFKLCGTSFAMSQRTAAATALYATCNVFFVNSYFSGHMGSLMYGAFAPALLHLGLKDPARTWRSRRRLFFLLLLAVAIAYTYPHPLVILAVPLALCHLLTSERTDRAILWLRTERVQQRRRFGLLVLALLVLAALGGFGLWHLTAEYRLRAAEVYRAWGYALDPLILPLMLGLLPSPVDGSRFVGNMLTYSTYLVLVVISCAATAALLRCYVRHALERSRFLIVFGLCWVGWYFFFLFLVRDSYYVYKFLYTQQFILIIGIAGYVVQTRSRAAKIFVAALAAVNLLCVGVSGWGLATRPYNSQPDRYEALMRIPRALLQESFLDLRGGDRIAVRQLYKQYGIKTVSDPLIAESFILPTDSTLDITSSQYEETVADAKGFILKKAPKKNSLFVRTWFEPEVYEASILGSTSFRWVGHRKNGSVGIFVGRPSPPEEVAGRYLRMCYQLGPSAVGPIDLTVTTADMRPLHSETLVGYQPSCVWLAAAEVLRSELPLLLSSKDRGKSILPYDDRILLYRVFAVDWTDRLFDSQVAPFFNAREDIVFAPAGAASVQLRLGWEVLETADGELFRWVGRAAEIAVTSKTDTQASCLLDLEPGPSLGNKPCMVECSDPAGNIVFTSEPIQRRTTIAIPLKIMSGLPMIFRLRTASDNLAMPGENRLLNFRVFRIWLCDQSDAP